MDWVMKRVFYKGIYKKLQAHNIIYTYIIYSKYRYNGVAYNT